jgi:hypothetical protein
VLISSQAAGLKNFLIPLLFLTPQWALRSRFAEYRANGLYEMLIFLMSDS